MRRKTAAWRITAVAVFMLLALGRSYAAGTEVSKLNYTYPPERLNEGHSFGNQYCYVTLDNKTDVPSDRSTPRFGLRESFNQKYYLLGWEVSLATPSGKSFVPVTTTFTPAYQESKLESGSLVAHKKFFLPFENNYRRSAHFLLEWPGADPEKLQVRSRLLLPEGTRVEASDFRGKGYLQLKFPDGAQGILWGGGLTSHAMREAVTQEENFGDMGPAGGSRTVKVVDVEVVSEYEWSAGADARAFALSFAYTLEENPNASTALLNAVFDIFGPQAGSGHSHVGRVQTLLQETGVAIDRYLKTTRLWTPDPLIDRGVQWAKINQLRLQQEVARGASFTNNPPSDIVVGRDTVWYVMGAAYYAQEWSRKLLDLWFRYGLDPNGKFVEYFAASREPIFKDDYGLNIADNTPLMLMAAHHYYSLTGDQGFLHEIYPRLLTSANYMLGQRSVGKNNQYGLVWCTSEDTFVRGLPVWRNAVPGYNLCGAPTELNAEVVLALRLVADLAKSLGDEANRARLESAARDLEETINSHLRSRTSSNPFYYLHINTMGEPVDDMTGDLLFPVLCGIADPPTSKQILQELFSEQFWASTADGAGGIRTVSSAQGGKWSYQAEAKAPGTDPNWNYGLLGGVWPNLAMWTARAAAAQGVPDLSLKALRGTYLLSERENPAHYNVVPGEISGYCNGDDLIQKEMPMSPFLPGIFIWSSMGSFLGITPRADGLEVNPALPSDWNWAAVSNFSYRGQPATILATREDRTVYTTVPVTTEWKYVAVPAALQERFEVDPQGSMFWLVVPSSGGLELFAGSAESTSGKLIEKRSRRVLAEISIPAGTLVRKVVQIQ